MNLSEKNSPTLSTREARNAFFAAIAVLSIAFLNISSLVAPLLAGQSISFLTGVEIVALVVLIIFAATSASLVLRGEIEPAVWRLIYAFAITAVFRILVRESIGLSYGVITAIVISAIGYLSLPLEKAGRATLMGYGIGGAIALVDLLVSENVGRQPTSPELVVATRNLAAFVFILQLVILLTQSRLLSLSTKIANYFSIFTLSAVLIIGISTIQIIDLWIGGGNEVSGFALLARQTLLRGTILMGVIVTFGGAALGNYIASTLTKPLSRFTEVAGRIAAGDREARAVVDSEDEIGVLAKAFNGMSDALTGMFGQLEARVADRTKDLERRALQIQTAAEIGRAATTLQDLGSLLTHTTRLISERFGFYHAGVFLLDPTGEYAVLQAANSEGGTRMLTRGHRLKVGQTGIVGYVTQTGNARIALDVGKDAVFFDNPDLPQTRSEMALPLTVGGQILGALDVQSIREQAFGEEDIATLRILADQLAIAIQNARLFSESQAALVKTREIYGELTRDAWRKVLRDQPRISFMATPSSTLPLSVESPDPDITKAVETGDLVIGTDGQTIGVPVKVRGQVIGAFRLKKQDAAEPWTEGERSLAIAFSEQLSGALESARLYRESQQRAAREVLVSDISARIVSLPRVDAIVRETVQELGQAFGNASVTFQLLGYGDKKGTAGDRGNGSEPGSVSRPGKKAQE